MARLVFRLGNEAKVIDLVEDAIGIGRRPENQIVLDDGFASGRHARIVKSAGGWWLEDLKSSNGTLLNGEKISQSRLQHGDVITIGRIQIGYFDDAPVKVRMSDTARLPVYNQAAEPDTVRTAPTPKPAPPAEPEIPTFSDADLTSLGPSTGVARPRPASAPHALEGARFIIPGSPESGDTDRRGKHQDAMSRTSQIPAAGIGSQGTTSAADLASLDALVGSIRSHRDREQKEKEDALARLRVEWDKTMSYAEQLRTKIGKDPRIKFFGVNRRADDVTIRYQRTPSSPVQMMMLSIQHPEDRGNAVQGIWLRRSGQQDRSFHSADEVAAELIRDFAFILA